MGTDNGSTIQTLWAETPLYVLLAAKCQQQEGLSTKIRKGSPFPHQCPFSFHTDMTTLRDSTKIEIVTASGFVFTEQTMKGGFGAERL